MVIDAPVPTSVPPQLPLYHFQLPPVPRLPPLTLKVTEPGPQMLDDDVLAAVAATDSELIVIVAVATTAGQPPAAANV